MNESPELLRAFKQKQRPIFITGGVGDGRAVELLRTGYAEDLHKLFFESNKAINFFAFAENIQRIAFVPVFADQFKDRYPDEIAVDEDNLVLTVRLNFDLERCLELSREELFYCIVEGFIEYLRGMKPIGGFDHVGFTDSLGAFLKHYDLY